MQVMSDRLVAISRAVSDHLNHGTINADLGVPDDKPTAELYDLSDGLAKDQ
ncbi:MAG: hypothetical protein L0Z53_22005 [Acidobacteriales bacterium]|nr:hypothetical protein [Terriglobales bacterium]